MILDLVATADTILIRAIPAVVIGSALTAAAIAATGIALQHARTRRLRKPAAADYQEAA